MKALQFSRHEARYVAANLASRFRPGAGARIGPLDLVEATDPPELPGPGWQRVWPRLTGICGSDLATIEGHASRYFEDYITFPFIPGHEIVGELADGQRVMIEPVLGHAARGAALPFPEAAPGDGDDYRHLVAPPLEPGIQIGSCESTGGGWATELVVHESQIHAVPDWMSDELAVTIEPVAGGIHAALKAGIRGGETVAVIGAGPMGLVTVAALRHLCDPGSILIAAKYPEQREMATLFGADVVVGPGELSRVVRSATGSFVIGDYLSGGADVVIDAIGSEASLQSALRMCRPRGRVVLLGMPGKISIDMTGLWHRETELVGSYTYGTETLSDGRRVRTFELAEELANKVPFDRMVSATYRLDEYQAAIEHAATSGPRGAVKVAFDMRSERHRNIRAH